MLSVPEVLSKLLHVARCYLGDSFLRGAFPRALNKDGAHEADGHGGAPILVSDVNSFGKIQLILVENLIEDAIHNLFLQESRDAWARGASLSVEAKEPRLAGFLAHPAIVSPKMKWPVTLDLDFF
jgi:hypothetical protein